MERPSRRRLLQALGLAGGAMLWPGGRARGFDAPSPKRVLFVVTSHGTVHERWSIRQGRPDDVDYTLDLRTLPADGLSPILAPLWSHRDRMVVLDGIGNGCAPTAGFLAHPAGNASCQTGRVPTEVPGSFALCDGPSIDQVIAATQDTPFPSLEWGVGGAPVAYNDLGQPLPFEQDVVAAWDRLFPTAGTGARPEESAAVRSRQGSVLDLAASRYDAVLQRLPAEEQASIALHRDLVRDLEVRIAALDALRCEATEAPIAASLPLPAEAAYPETLTGIYADLAVAALSCGMTRVITLRVDTIPTATIGAPPGDLHNDLAHAVGSDPEAREWMSRHHAFLARQVAALLDKLAAVPEGDGSLLDHTLVVWHNEMSTGDHLFHTVPVVLAGATETLRGGTYRRWAPRLSVQGRFGTEWIGQPHNKLLTTIGAAMDLPIDRFGVESLTQTGGAPLDCTGLLDGVLA